MADFLTRMAERTLGMLPVVQPILTSQYSQEPRDIAAQEGPIAVTSPPGPELEEEIIEDWNQPPAQLHQAPDILSSSKRILPERQVTSAPQPLDSQTAHAPTPAPPGQQDEPASQFSHEIPPLQRKTREDQSSSLLPLSRPPGIDQSSSSNSPVDAISKQTIAPIAKPSKAPFSAGADGELSGEIPLTSMEAHLIAPSSVSSNVEAQLIRSPSPPAIKANLPSTQPPTLLQTTEPVSENGAHSNSPIVPILSSSNVGAQFIAPLSASPNVGKQPIAPATPSPKVGVQPIVPNRPPSFQSPGAASAHHTYQTQPIVPASESPNLGAQLIAPSIVPFPVSHSQPIRSARHSAQIGLIQPEKHSAASLQEDSATSTIRVTIGRIDVRAVPPTPSASPAPTKSNRTRPALSLSDYLKQRKGGQR